MDKSKSKRVNDRFADTRSLFTLRSFYCIIRGCIQKSQDSPPGARTTNGTAPCH